MERLALWERYRNYLAAFQHPTWTEVIAMARASRRGWGYYLDPLFEELGPEAALEQLARYLTEGEGSKSKPNLRPFFKRFGVKRILEGLTEAELQELMRELERGSKG